MTDKHYYLIFNEREALREQNDRLRAQLVAAGKACEEAATALIARDAQLMAKDAEIASLKSANEYMERRLEKYRRLDDISMEMKTSLREDNERLRKELASLLDAACTHRYYESRLRDELSKAIDQAATSLAK